MKILFVTVFVLTLSVLGIAQEKVPATCLQKEATLLDGNWVLTSPGGGSYVIRQDPGEKSLMQIDFGRQTILLAVPVGIDLPEIEILGVIKNSGAVDITPGSGWTRLEFTYYPIKPDCKEIQDQVLEAVQKLHPGRKVTY